MRYYVRALAVVALLSVAPFRSSIGFADEKLKGIACRSVHLGYPAAEGTVFYNELTVEKSAAGTYFMACGYSFIEDFQRDRVSATKVRRARFGNGWLRTNDGQWVALTRARFTGDGNPVTNIDAGAAGGRYFLATGGETDNTGAKLNTFDNLNPPGIELPPAILDADSPPPLVPAKDPETKP